jgi:hypothetical protein
MVGCLLAFIVLVVSAFIALNLMDYATPGVMFGLIGGGLMALIAVVLLCCSWGPGPWRSTIHTSDPVLLRVD